MKKKLLFSLKGSETDTARIQYCYSLNVRNIKINVIQGVAWRCHRVIFFKWGTFGVIYIYFRLFALFWKNKYIFQYHNKKNLNWYQYLNIRVLRWTPRCVAPTLSPEYQCGKRNPLYPIRPFYFCFNSTVGI